MTITLNNRTESFKLETYTIKELLAEKKFTFKNLVIKVNGNLIKKDKYSETKVKDGDKVDIIHMISGG
ncbi:MAG: sulfur carrier protein ThiS [Chlorobi bacterium]|nr:sulfur carrier protein ThiS [Chlorobiota bacterium]